MLYRYVLRIYDDPDVNVDMFYDLDDLEVIVDTQHGICFVELPMDVSISQRKVEARAFSIEIEVLLPKCKVYNIYVDTFIHF